MTDPGDYGVVIRNAASVVLPVTSVAIYEPVAGFPSRDTIKITPASGSMASFEIAYANASDTTDPSRTSGPRACIHDSETETIDGVAMLNHVVPYKGYF